jgi:triacylglycerol esterase/lipase EstA (alpha/beta hydrolase family)
MGIHNRTYGTVFDLVECLIQRCFSYSTKDTRVLYDQLKEILMDKNIRKCVVIAHSQGGIILSTALDSLFADVPSGTFEKLEIYTFGSSFLFSFDRSKSLISLPPTAVQQITSITQPASSHLP